MSSGIKPNEQTLQGLQDAAGHNDLSGMSPEQMKDLAKKLRENESALQSALKDSPGFDTSHIPIAQYGDGEGKEGDEDGPDGDGKPGRGGANRGRGDAPMAFSKDATDLNSKDTGEGHFLRLDVCSASPRATPWPLPTASTRWTRKPKQWSQNKMSGGTLQNNGGQVKRRMAKTRLVPCERDGPEKYFSNERRLVHHSPRFRTSTFMTTNNSAYRKRPVICPSRRMLSFSGCVSPYKRVCCLASR